MQQLRFEAARERGHFDDGINVGSQRLVDGREELDEAGAVDDEIDAVGPAGLLNACIRLGGVPGPDGDLVAEEGAAQGCEKRREGRGIEDVRFETLLGGLIAFGANEQMDLTDIGVAIEQQGEQDFAQKAIATGQQDLAAGES